MGWAAQYSYKYVYKSTTSHTPRALTLRRVAPTLLPLGGSTAGDRDRGQGPGGGEGAGICRRESIRNSGAASISRLWINASPTDPVGGSALARRDEVPERGVVGRALLRALPGRR